MANVIELVVRLRDQLSQPLGQTEGKLRAFGARIQTLVGAAGIAGLATATANFVKTGFQAADAIGDAAERAGIAVESLSRLKFAADQNDIEFSSLTTSLKRWQVTLSQAASGSKEAQSALDLLKLSATQLKSLSLEEQLRTIADQFRRIKDPADQTRVAVELFGRSGEQLVPLLKQGGTAIAALTAEADRLGITLDGKAVRSIDAADKALKKLKATISSFGSRVAGEIALAIVGPQDELDAATLKLEALQDQLGALSREAIEGGYSPEVEQRRRTEINQAITQQLRAINAIRRRMAAEAAANPLQVPVEFVPLDEVRTTARSKPLEGMNKLLQDFEEQTRTSLESANREFEKTRLKLQELLQGGIISAEEFQKRMEAARLKFNEAIDIEPVQVSVQKVAEGLNKQQRAVQAFVGTLKEGLANLAMSGELTGKAIVRYLLSAIQSKILMKAIDALGAALQSALTKKGSGGSWWASLLQAAFSAGGGESSGPRVVGEEGPELLLSSGKVMNRRQLAFAMGGSGGGATIEIGDTNIVVQGNADQRALAMMEARQQQNNRKLLEQISRLLKDNYGRELR